MIPERFSLYLADTAYSQSLHHHLRYKVYCERKHYEDGTTLEKFPQERDEFDAVATRFIIRDILLDSWIGTARLIANDEQLMPVQRLGAVDNGHNRLLTDHACAEISRLATLCAYGSSQIRASLLQTVILGALAQSRECGIEWLIFLVSPGLARMVGYLGVSMEPCGGKIEHHGPRRAYRAHVERGIAELPWAEGLRRGHQGYELFSSEREAAAA